MSVTELESDSLNPLYFEEFCYLQHIDYDENLEFNISMIIYNQTVTMVLEEIDLILTDLDNFKNVIFSGYPTTVDRFLSFDDVYYFLIKVTRILGTWGNIAFFRCSWNARLSRTSNSSCKLVSFFLFKGDYNVVVYVVGYTVEH